MIIFNILTATLTMKTIYLIRHAKSSWDHPGLSDKDRPLAKRGLNDAPLMADLLKRKGAKPDRLVSSPARRAYTTATLFAMAYDLPVEQIQVIEGIYEAFSGKIVSLIQQLDEADQTVFIFGHNPTFTDVANVFKGRYIDNIPTCGIVGIEAQVDSWKEFNAQSGEKRTILFPKENL